MNNDPMMVQHRSRIAWWALTLVLGAVLAVVIYAFLGSFVLGVFIYYATRPIYERFGDRVPSPNIGAAVALLTISLPVLLLIGYTVAIAVSAVGGQLGSLGPFQNALAEYVDSGMVHSPEDLLTLITTDPGALTSIVTPDTIQNVAGSLGAYLGMVASGALKAFIALIVAFYLLRDDHKLAHWARHAIGRNDDTLIAYGTAVDTDLKTIFFGNILNAFVVALTSVFAYNALNLIAPTGGAIPTPTLLGLLAGAASLIPVVGMKIVYVPVGIYMLVTGGLTNIDQLWFPIAFLLVSVLLIDGLTELILRPYISGRNLHVGLVLFAYMLGPLLFGWYGLFLGPLLLVLIVHLARIVVPELIHGDPLTPGAIGADPIPDPISSDAPQEHDDSDGVQEGTTDDHPSSGADDHTDEADDA